MKLHYNKEVFLEIIEVVSTHRKIPEEFIEKDYYVSLLLKELVELYPHIVFKGGTSLSKCYRLINRFSEDIDISVHSSINVNDMVRRELKRAITSAISNVQLNLINTKEIRSRANFNQYKVEFVPTSDETGGLRDHLLIESYLFSKPFPYEFMEVSSYIYDYLIEEKYTDIVEKFDLNTFKMKVQKVDRTLVDKIFAICDYFEEALFTQNSRHLYDIHKIWSSNDIIDKEGLRHLMKEVASERSTNKKNQSAKKEYELNETLNKIITNDVYKDDYNEITQKLLYSECSYEEVKTTLLDIVNSPIIPKQTEHLDFV